MGEFSAGRRRELRNWGVNGGPTEYRGEFWQGAATMRSGRQRGLW